MSRDYVLLLIAARRAVLGSGSPTGTAAAFVDLRCMHLAGAEPCQGGIADARRISASATRRKATGADQKKKRKENFRRNLARALGR